MPTVQQELHAFLDEAFVGFEQLLDQHEPRLAHQEFGEVTYVGHGIARVKGIPGVQLDELVTFADGLQGMVFNLDDQEVGVILLGKSQKLHAGSQVFRTGRVIDVPVGQALLGRVVNAMGQPIDDLGPVRTAGRRAVEQSAPAIMERSPVTEPLQTGCKVIDALLPIGRGQRELILGDRQIGKTAIALDTIINQADKDVLCIYCVVGQRNAQVARFITDLRMHGALAYTVVVMASGEDAPGLQFIAPYAATTMAEHFMLRGRDVLIIYDDLTHHARSYRELSLLLRRPPGREAYPGDIFYIHSRLLERSTHLREEFGGGSLTALPIIETQAQDMSAYIPTNLISITDGQIYLSPALFQKGMLPAVDVGRSVSRVGGKAQLPAYRSVAGALRLAYAQFEELEIFSRFSTRLDEQTRATLNRGQRVREILKQPQYKPVSAVEQVAVLLAVTQGLLDDLPLERIADAEAAIRSAVIDQVPDICRRIQEGESLGNVTQERLLHTMNQALAPITSSLAGPGDVSSAERDKGSDADN